jgi:hypothetical protein
LVDFINEECKDVGRLIFDSIPTIAFLATAFWSFALFDTLGDSTGTQRALWILILVAFMPFWIYFLEIMYAKLKDLYFYLVIENSHSLDGSMFRASGFTDNSTRQSMFSRPTFLDSFRGSKSAKSSMQLGSHSMSSKAVTDHGAIELRDSLYQTSLGGPKTAPGIISSRQDESDEDT